MISCGLILINISELNVTGLDGVSDPESEDSLDISFSVNEDSDPDINWTSHEEDDE